MTHSSPWAAAGFCAGAGGFSADDGGFFSVGALFPTAGLTGADAAAALGTRARETVERSLSWERYTNALWELLAR